MYQRIFSPEAFAARRRRVAERIGEPAVAVIQGARGRGRTISFGRAMSCSIYAG